MGLSDEMPRISNKDLDISVFFWEGSYFFPETADVRFQFFFLGRIVSVQLAENERKPSS